MKKFAKVLVLVLVVAFAMVMLVSCGTPNGAALKKKLEDKGYFVVYAEGAEAEEDADGALYTLLATKDLLSSNPQMLSVIAFKDSATMKKYTDSQDYKDAKAQADKSGYVIKTSGNAIIIGTKDAAALV